MSGLIVALSGASCSNTDAAQRRALRRLVGPGLLVAVGYIDPGNWATGIAGGSGYGYGLLSVVLAAALLAMGFQVLVARLALATGQDLAALTARYLPRPLARAAWLAGEGAILATALAELIGGAIALRLLFGLPLAAGVAATALGTLAVMLLAGRAGRGMPLHERVIAVLLGVVAFSFVYLLAAASPDWGAVAAGAAEPGRALRDPAGFMIALGILGATLMPHNLYLHSGELAERGRELADRERPLAMRLARNDTALSLGVAMAINAAIMIVAAASLTGVGAAVSSLDEAHAAIGRTLGAGAALVFAVALYAAGQSSAITGVMAGRILSQGFRRRAGSAGARALFTRIVAGSVAVALLGMTGGQDPDALLVLSQVVLSLALPFALVPLVWLALRRDVMGAQVLRGAPAAAAVAATALIVALDAVLLADVLLG